MKVPFFMAVGGREAASGTVALRRLGSNEQQVLDANETIIMLRNESLAPDMQSR
jgi:threonyl-tRNA synthetase